LISIHPASRIPPARKLSRRTFPAHYRRFGLLTGSSHTCSAGLCPLHSPAGQVIGYYDHQGAKAGLELTGHYANIAQNVYQPDLAMPGLLEHLLPGASAIVARGLEEWVERHHPYPKFMGGPAAQELVELIANKHRAFHADLAAALREAGFPQVGGRTGSADHWFDYFKTNPGTEDKAIEILRQVTADFDRTHGTLITPKLEKAPHSVGKGVPSP
jgi:hypothetical protein